MNELRNYFRREGLSVKALLVFSVLAGMITGVIALFPALDKTSFHNVAVCLEMWILLAVLLISRCRTPLESAVKCFVFFLISQPLVYLVQVPFSSLGFGLFRYYRYWFILTLLTFPGAALGWFCKKDRRYSVLILAAAEAILFEELYTHTLTLLSSFPYQLLAVLFILAELLFLPWLLFENKKHRAFSILLAAVLAAGFLIFVNARPAETECISVTELPESGTFGSISAEEGITAEISEDGTSLIVRGSEDGEYEVRLSAESGKTYIYRFTVSGSDSELSLISPEE